MSLINCSIVFDTETNQYLVVNSETKETTPLNLGKAKVSKKTVKEPESDVPEITLDSSKIILNTAAVKTLGVEAGAEVAVAYIKIPDIGFTPVIGDSSVLGVKGNKLTKSNTISCRGQANDRLKCFGDKFTMSPNPEGSKSWILTGNKAKATPEVESVSAEPDPEVIESLKSIQENTSDEDVFTTESIDNLLNSI